MAHFVEKWMLQALVDVDALLGAERQQPLKKI
jgi:hypothetical protein